MFRVVFPRAWHSGQVKNLFEALTGCRHGIPTLVERLALATSSRTNYNRGERNINKRKRCKRKKLCRRAGMKMIGVIVNRTRKEKMI